MKKIDLSKETLRVLTWQEAAAVAGGVLTDCACPNTLQISCPPPPPMGNTTLTGLGNPPGRDTMVQPVDPPVG